MATTISKFSSANQYIFDGSAPTNGVATLKVALVTSGYTFNAANSIWASASGSELAAGNGYTTGGVAIATPVSSLVSGVGTLTGGNVSWTFTASKTFRAAILYSNTSINSVVNPMLAYILFDNTPADITVPSTTFAIYWSASGILTIGPIGP